MKQHWILAFGSLSIMILSACAGLSNRAASLSDNECHEAWFSLSIPWTTSDEDVMYDILNKEHPPDTVGEQLQSCIRRGWRPLSAQELNNILTCGGKYTHEELDTYSVNASLDGSHCDTIEDFVAVAQSSAVPTISLLEPDAIRGSTAAPPITPDEAGCQNENATISSPISGEEVRGLVEVLGSANIPNFAFYKIEIRLSEPNSIWQVITAGTETITDDVLGTWDTSLVDYGAYLLQLVVTDTVGNAPFPCTIEIMVLPEAG